MRMADIFFDNLLAGHLVELEYGRDYQFEYDPRYDGPPISQTIPVRREVYSFKSFPPFFDGLLPEGFQLEALLRREKLDRNDLFGQLLMVGADMVGAVTAREHQ